MVCAAAPAPEHWREAPVHDTLSAFTVLRNWSQQMPVPWAQIVRLMPSILELSHELLKRTRHLPQSEVPAPKENDPAVIALEERITTLEENERKQAELVTNMAEQLEQLTMAVTVLHRRWRLLMVGLVATGAVALVALITAVRLSLVHTLP